ncbi:hypothetical protein [Hydrogenophaga sp.]|uniref:hypothetical protein n=1 Tax=Hydrogenophaga sp. TaxID=1904254 RepID=UPI002FC5E915
MTIIPSEVHPIQAHPIALRAGDTLVTVDVQSDFLPGGSLAAPRGDEVVAVLNGQSPLSRIRACPWWPRVTGICPTIAPSSRRAGRGRRIAWRAARVPALHPGLETANPADKPTLQMSRKCAFTGKVTI